jgi:Uncharacterized conserved protein
VAARLARLGPPDAVPRAEVTVLDPWRPRVVRRADLRSAHLSEGAAVLPDGRTALVPAVRAHNLVPITQVAEGWVMTSGLALVRLDRDDVVQVCLDEVNACFADPTGVAVAPDGRAAWIASGGGDVVTLVDLERLEALVARTPAERRDRLADDLQAASECVLARVPVGPNPRGLAIAPDGRRLFVAERLGDSVAVVDTASRRVAARFRLAEVPDDPVWRGARIFFSARNSFLGQFSCRSCHPDGGVDGLVYDFDIDGLGRNLVDNRSLLGVAGTRPLKWNGKNPSLFAQCGFRFALVLTRTDPIAGRNLADLVAFIRSLPPATPPPVPRDAVWERGRALFFATRTPDGRPLPREQQCPTCHPPPLYTDHRRRDVGTRSPTDSTGSFDTPHLLGIATSAPYLHDGRAATLEEIWTVYNPEDRHGITSRFSKHDLNALVRFLKSL